MPKIEKLYVEKGLSIEVTEGKWRRQTYGITLDVSEELADIPQEQWGEWCNKVKEDAEKKIDEWLNIGETVVRSPGFEPGPVSVNGIPKLDIADLNSLPWNPPAATWGQEWIKNPSKFTKFECEGLPTLLELSKALFSTGKTMKEQKLIIGDMEYSFSGKDKETGEPKRLFIQRRQVKVK